MPESIHINPPNGSCIYGLGHLARAMGMCCFCGEVEQHSTFARTAPFHLPSPENRFRFLCHLFSSIYNYFIYSWPTTNSKLSE